MLRKRTVGESAADQWVAGLSNNYLLCRDIGHTWRPFRARWSEQDRAYERVLKCGRCQTERIQYVDQYGGLGSSHYVYSEGYQRPSGAGHMEPEDRTHLRLESVLRLLGEDEQ